MVVLHASLPFGGCKKDMQKYCEFSRYKLITSLPQVWEDWDMYHTVRVLKREWWFATNQTEKADKNLGAGDGSDDNLTLKHISGSFYILIALLILCSVTFVLEHFHSHRKLLGRTASKAWKSLVVCFDKIFVVSRKEMDPYT